MIVEPDVSSLSHADRTAMDRLLSVRPRWRGLATAREAIGIDGCVALHAGPPLTGPPCRPIANSIAAAAVFEGWADTLESALRMVATGEIELRAAQDEGAVVPLAAVLTPSMIVQIVADAQGQSRAAVAPLNGGGGPALRLGTATPAVVEHLRWLNGTLAQELAPLADTGVDLIPIADAALAEGDDCHGRTAAATRRLFALVCATRGEVTEPVRRFFETGPSFFLNLWMAACRCMAEAACGIAGSSLVVAIGANGKEIGVKLAGAPRDWVTSPAAVPSGALMPGFRTADCLAAIGDSALVDALGFGAMAMHHAPAQQEVLARFMPEASEVLGARIFAVKDSRFAKANIRTGSLAHTLAEDGRPLAVALGILDRNGVAGRVGGGIAVPPAELFRTAVHRLRAA